MDEEHPSFWHRLFFGSSAHSEREQRVLAYVVHRIGSGAHLADVIMEEYVRRNVSQEELRDILQDPALISACHESMMREFSSGRLAPKPPSSSAQ
jgi:hypothetical protein